MQTKKEPILDYKFIDSPCDLDRAFDLLFIETEKTITRKKKKLQRIKNRN